MVRSIEKLDVVAVAAAASPIVESRNRRDNKRDAGEETEIKLKKKKVGADFGKMKTIQDLSNGNDAFTKGFGNRGNRIGLAPCSQKLFGNRIGLAPCSQKQKFSSETDSSSMKVISAVSAALPDFKSVNKRGVNTRKKLKKKAADFKKKKKAWDLWKRKATEQKIQEFSNKNSSSNDQTTPSAPQVQSTTSAPQVQSAKASKTVTVRNIPNSIHKSDLIEFFKQAGEVVDAWYVRKYQGRCHIKFATEEAVKKALELDGQNLCYREIVVSRYGTRITGSKTLIAKHLNLFTKSDVIEYFKWAGEIIDVRFSSLDDGNFSGYCHIEFENEEAAKRAAKCSGQQCLGRPFELGFAHETICVRGFDTTIKFDQIHSSLEELFSTCGKILWMHIPTFPHSSVTLGKAFIEFYDLRAFPKALALDGHILGGFTLRVEDAIPLELHVKPPGRRMKIGARPVGPYSGSVYAHRYFPHRGWGGAGIGKPEGLLNKSAGKKVVFDDDSPGGRTGKKVVFDDDSPGGRTVDWVWVPK